MATFGVLWCLFAIHFEIHTATEYIYICLFHKWCGDSEDEVSNDIVCTKSLEPGVNMWACFNHEDVKSSINAIFACNESKLKCNDTLIIRELCLYFQKSIYT